jgi:hypothetical protein
MSWMRAIDLPYRFGPDAFAHIAPGESYVRLDGRMFSAGVSTASQIWGPSRYNPLVLGNNAGGFEHLFVETHRTIPLGVGSFRGRWLAGRLRASPYGPNHVGISRRLGIGAVGVFSPIGLRGFEIGAARFFALYDSASVRDAQSLLLPFSGLLKYRLSNVDVPGARQQNQVASVFARIAPVGSPLQVYGEFFRDDHSWDARDFVLEPDHNSGYSLGFLFTRRSNRRVRSLTVELVNSRISHIDRIRKQGPLYSHSFVVEGHTQFGKTLGSPLVPGGGGWTAVFESAGAHQYWQFVAQFSRIGQNSEGGNLFGQPSGVVSLGISKATFVRRREYVFDVRLQPGFGDVPGTNVAIGSRIGLQR